MIFEGLANKLYVEAQKFVKKNGLKLNVSVDSDGFKANIEQKKPDVISPIYFVDENNKVIDGKDYKE